MDGCHDCRDSMFCHNSENLDHCMFCFNTKSLKYAIGNSEIGEERYKVVRKVVLEELVKELEQNGSLS